MAHGSNGVFTRILISLFAATIALTACYAVEVAVDHEEACAISSTDVVPLYRYQNAQDAWYVDSECTVPYEPQALPLGPYRLYARNWASVRYLHGRESDPGVTYTAKDGRSGPVDVAAVTPEDFEAPYGTTVTLGDVANRRLRFEGAAAFPSTIRARPDWHDADDDGSASRQALTVRGDGAVYKLWTASIYDGYVGDKD